ADARAMPFGNGAYKTIIYATGVIDFMGDEEEIGAILTEGRRIVSASGVMFVAFYRMSAATEKLLIRLGLLQNNVFHHKEVMEIYKLKPVQAITWVAKRGKVSFVRAAMLSLGSWGGSTWQERRNAFSMRRIFANEKNAHALVRAAPEQ